MTYQTRRGNGCYYVTKSFVTAITRRSLSIQTKQSPSTTTTSACNSPWSFLNLNLIQGKLGHIKQKRHIRVASRQATAAIIKSPAKSVSLSSVIRAQNPHHHHRVRLQYEQRGANSSIFPPTYFSLSRSSFSTTSRVSCSAIIPSSIMADRDILPAAVKPSHYDLSISSMNFDDWSYQGQVL